MGLLAALVSLWSARSDAQPIGGAFQLNDFTSGSQAAPAIAVPPGTGDFVVVWESAGQDGDDLGLFGRRHGELISAVAIALNDRPGTGCIAADADGDGRIAIDDLVRAVRSALNGCGARRAA